MSRWLDLARSVSSPAANSANSANRANGAPSPTPFGTIGANGTGEGGENSNAYPPLTAADVESFRALRAEVCFSLPEGSSFWLVPELTGQNRRELTPEDLLHIDRLRRGFPGEGIVTAWTWAPKVTS